MWDEFERPRLHQTSIWHFWHTMAGPVIGERRSSRQNMPTAANIKTGSDLTVLRAAASEPTSDHIPHVAIDVKLI